eukprot:3765653-Rhodomonas_salina.1
MTNHISNAEWLAQGGTLDGHKSTTCPKFCLQPGLYENSLIDAEMEYILPISSYMALMTNKFADVGLSW